MALHLARSRHRSLTNPSLLRLFSTSSNDPNNGNAAANGNYSADNPSSVSSYFGNARANRQNLTSKPVSTTASLNEIRNNLSEFRRRSAVPPPAESSRTHSQSEPRVSFQEIHRRNILAERGESNESSDGFGPGRKISFDAIKNSMRQMSQDSGANNVWRKQGSFPSLSEFKRTLNLQPSGDKVVSPVIGGSLTDLPASIFEKEMKDRAKGGELAMKTEFVRTYNYEDLGEKLKQLRPPEKKKGGGWFSLQELNERLVKLREIDEKEAMEARNRGNLYVDIRQSLQTLKISDAEKREKSLARRVEILDVFSRTPAFMMHPPKEHLVEKYFHPDNMSSGEKMKIELAKVRDEFKMSESDCGSARVQVAQLTTKIKHLSSVLHKKDKHSRKGLQAMVQKRKKLLKYLRRTDWDSYCFVLSKLGLRDTADSKN
ncbi:hypothetical protein like AT1G80620 [Hibiscus trionum]|uniref:Small ribosomal subunit protein uS15c n=1 Tax=Hibiscus trionum TaxID=183268 RepID=A0A9W7MXD7_HIBTR|nr:hypothetical protein like AT1G80620 [Hibiscus trionum]